MGDAYFQDVSNEIVTAFISVFPDSVHPFKKEEINPGLAITYFQNAVGPRIIDTLKRVLQEKDKEHEVELMELRKRLDVLQQPQIIQETNEKETVASSAIDDKLKNSKNDNLSLPDIRADNSLGNLASTIEITEITDGLENLAFKELVKKAEGMGIKVAKKKSSPRAISDLIKAIRSKLKT